MFTRRIGGGAAASGVPALAGTPEIAILTNARAADQRSMIGYGELLIETARQAGYDTAEWRAVSLFSRLRPGFVFGNPVRKLVANIDRFVVTPLVLAGRKANIIHIVDPGNVTYLNVIRHCASIVTVHDVIPYLAAEGRLQGFRPTPAGRRLMTAILRRLRRVDRVVCASENTRRDLLSLVDLDPERVITIPLAVFQTMQRASATDCAAVRERLRLPATAPLILHVGSNAFYKNRRSVLDVFAQTAIRHPDAVLLFVGPRSPDLIERAARLGVSDRVHYAERVAQQDLAAVYSTASVVLFPSLYEGFGYPVLEAQLCGTPVVCSNAGSLPEVGGAATVMADPLDIDALATAVDRVLSDPAFAASLQRAGLINARRFDAGSWRAAHERLYAALSPSPAHTGVVGQEPAT